MNVADHSGPFLSSKIPQKNLKKLLQLTLFCKKQDQHMYNQLNEIFDNYTTETQKNKEMNQVIGQ